LEGSYKFIAENFVPFGIHLAKFYRAR